MQQTQITMLKAIDTKTALLGILSTRLLSFGLFSLYYATVIDKVNQINKNTELMLQYLDTTPGGFMSELVYAILIAALIPILLILLFGRKFKLSWATILIITVVSVVLSFTPATPLNFARLMNDISVTSPSIVHLVSGVVTISVGLLVFLGLRKKSV